jgi:ABC-2 type transport system ATP-binding protein
MLNISHISKQFVRDRWAVRDISFDVARGEIFGLLGHNGAGKSTLLGTILGMVYPDAGEVTIDGISVQKERTRALRSVGAIFESPAFYDYLSGWKNLQVLATLSGFTDEKAMRETVELVGLTGRIDHKVRTYSHGMRQRLALAQALLPEPRLLLLDEPTDGLDPEGIIEFRQFVQRLRDERGLTILFNSHLLSEVELLCDRVAIIKRGELKYVGNGQDLRTAHHRLRCRVEKTESLPAFLTQFGGQLLAPDLIELPLEHRVTDFVTAVVQAGLGLHEITPCPETLEDLYHKISA